MIILFIDDEPQYIKPYTQAFEISDFNVKVFPNVDIAWDFICSHTDEILAIILDIMMPPGKLFDFDKTKEGLRTGILLVERLRELDERIPIVILTNAEKSELGSISHRHCLIFAKKEIGPWGLVEKVSDMKRRAKLDD
jgi:DNA-binding response OmpR family regulator